MRKSLLHRIYDNQVHTHNHWLVVSICSHTGSGKVTQRAPMSLLSRRVMTSPSLINYIVRISGLVYSSTHTLGTPPVSLQPMSGTSSCENRGRGARTGRKRWADQEGRDAESRCCSKPHPQQPATSTTAVQPSYHMCPSHISHKYSAKGSSEHV